MRIHGRNGLIYLSAQAGQAASPLIYQASWSLAVTHDAFENTKLGAAQKTYVAGLPEAAGTFAGFWDDSTGQAYLAAADGLPRNMYIYPSALEMGKFFSAQVLADLTITGDVGGAVAVTSSWAAVTALQRADSGSSSPAAGVAAASGSAAVGTFSGVYSAAYPNVY